MSTSILDKSLAVGYGCAGATFLASEVLDNNPLDVSDSWFKVSEIALVCISVVQLGFIFTYNSFPVLAGACASVYVVGWVFKGLLTQLIDRFVPLDLKAIDFLKELKPKIRAFQILPIFSAGFSICLGLVNSPVHFLGLIFAICLLSRGYARCLQTKIFEFTYSGKALPGESPLPDKARVIIQEDGKGAAGSYTISHQFACLKTPQKDLDENPSLAPVQLCSCREHFLTANQLKQKLEARSLAIATLMKESDKSIRINYVQHFPNGSYHYEGCTFVSKIFDKTVEPFCSCWPRQRVGGLSLKGKITVWYKLASKDIPQLSYSLPPAPKLPSSFKQPKQPKGSCSVSADISVS